VCRLMPTASFDATQGREQLLGRDGIDRAAAEIRIESITEASPQDRERSRCERLALQREPFLRHDFKGVKEGCSPRLSLDTGIDVASQELARLIALLARAFERHIGIRTERDELFKPADPISEAPQPTARGRHEQKKPALIEQLVGAIARLGGSDPGLVELRHSNNRVPQWRQHTPLAHPRSNRVTRRRPWRAMDGNVAWIQRLTAALATGDALAGPRKTS